MKLRPAWRPRSRVLPGIALSLGAACGAAGGAPSQDQPAPVHTGATAIPTPVLGASSQIALPQVIAREGDTEAPFGLTAADGSGLQLVAIQAKAVYQGPLAFTELSLTFHNPENRTREGTFAITLPEHAAVSRFAMQAASGEWLEAEVVEKQLARRAYDDFLHRRQDPALLEKAEGNRFTARVFPIPANGDKHIVLSYSQELAGAQYVLPLRGLPKIGDLDVHLDVLTPDGKHTEQTLAKHAWQPTTDFVSNTSVAAAAVGAGQAAVAQVMIGAPGDATGDAPKSLTLLVDTSASRSLGYATYIQRVHALVAAIAKQHGGAMPLQVFAFDQTTQPIFDGRADAWSAAQDKQLAERGAAGASDLAQALAYLGAHKSNARVVVLTDGVLTAGATGADLVSAAKQVRGLERIDVVLAGGIRDDGMAAELARASTRAGAVLDLDGTSARAGVDDVARGLGEKISVDIALDVPGATWAYPRQIASVRPGTPVLVYAQYPTTVQQMQVTVGGKAQAFAIAAAAPALVTRAAAGAQIADLDEKLAVMPAHDPKLGALKQQIAQLSVSARVVSSQTSLLVLESDSDYARYGIDRRTLADILAIGPHGVELTRRAAVIADAPKPEPMAKVPPHRYAYKTAGGGKGDEPEKADKVTMADEKEPELENETMALDEGKMGKKNFDDSGDGDVEGGVEGGVAGGELGGVAAPGPSGRIAAQEHEPADTATRGMPTTPAPVATPSAEPPPPPPAPPAAYPMNHRASADPAVARDQAIDNARASGVLGSTSTGHGAGSGSGRATVVRSYTTESSEFVAGEGAGSADAWPPPGSPTPLTGPLASIEAQLVARKLPGALAEAKAWHEKEPGNVLALIGYGDSLEANHQLDEAARIYGSIIDLFPSRADLRRFAGERLERVGNARQLIVDTYQRAVDERPDHLTGHRLLAYALYRAGKPADAFAAILKGIDQPYPSGRFLGGDQVLREDAGMLGAALIAADPSQRTHVAAELAKRGTALPTGPSTRFILYWETDGNDVDFHIQDAKGGHAWYGSKHLPSGGDLYADITTGYGPECFAIQGRPSAGPYRLSINYYSQGPMGYGMGLLQIVKFDGKGKLAFEDRPYEIMTNQAFVDLGIFKP
ncbi:MAG TPA: VIT domain-containing protein [Kofleriaceae bacterium]